MKKKINDSGVRSQWQKVYVDPSKNSVDPSIQVHSNDLFSETTAPMVLKFHMQHNLTARPFK